MQKSAGQSCRRIAKAVESEVYLRKEAKALFDLLGERWASLYTENDLSVRPHS
jgi:hypothetical protein